MAFDLDQHYGNPPEERKRLTFKDCAHNDIFDTFLNTDEHAEVHTVDGKEMKVILEDNRIQIHSSHWEGGAKQNFDTGLYDALVIIYIAVEDYGPKPKSGRLIVLDKGTDRQRTYVIKTCEEEDGFYRMTVDRVRQ